WVPIVALLTACVVPLWKFYMAEPPVPLSLGSLLWPLIVVVLVCIALHVLISVLLPLRWPNIREEFQRQLALRLQADMAGVYAAIPEDAARQLREERALIETLQKEAREVADWLAQREQAASIVGLYGR